MTIIELRQALIDGITEAMPNLTGGVQAHGGAFTAEEVRQISQKSPAIRLGCVGISDFEDNGNGVDALTTWSCMIIASDRPGSPRDDAALALVGSLLPLIPNHGWGDFPQRPERLLARNLYSAGLKKIGVALWAITWNQRAELSTIDAATLDDLLQVNVEYDLEPADGNMDARDQIDLAGASTTEDTDTIVDSDGNTVVDSDGNESTGS